MKCISLWQPWASLIVIGAKRFETRSWPTSHRGTILIHAAQKWNLELETLSLNAPFANAIRSGLGRRNSFRDAVGILHQWGLPLGCIIGVAEVVECYKVVQDRCAPDGTGIYLESNKETEEMPVVPELDFGDFSVGRYAWQLANPRRFANPIPYRGHQQIFNVPDEVVAEQMKAVAA